MTNYLCHPEKNFVKGAQYTKQTLPSDISQSTATKECVRLAKGRDFFVQQRDDGHTFCGIFNNKLDSDSDYLQHDTHHKWGTVCHEPGQVLTYKADEDRLKDKLLTRRLR